MARCSSKGCNNEVSKSGHNLCYSCWKKENGNSSDKKKASSSGRDMLTATKLGQNFEISGQKMNLLLNELGWTFKPRHGKGWAATKQGKRQGASARKVSQSGVPYVVWPEKILSSRVLNRAVADFKGEAVPKKQK